jgi:hypothetical protein
MPRKRKKKSMMTKRKEHSRRVMRINRRFCVFVRELLLFALGRECKACGAARQLTFDCVKPDGAKRHHGAMSWRQRMNFYWAEFERGNLQVLCLGCNSAKQDREGWALSLFGERFSIYNTRRAA